jgi:histone H3/H4
LLNHDPDLNIFSHFFTPYFRSSPPRRKAKDETGDKHIARALHAILQRPGMPVNRITCRAVQVMVDMMRDLMEGVMDEAATCADSNGRVTIDSTPSESLRT